MVGFTKQQKAIITTKSISEKEIELEISQTQK
jgi:hypothetical protein